MKFKLTISKTILTSKPENGIIKNSIRNVLETDLKGLSQIVLKVPFITSVLEVKGHSPTNKDWHSQQVFAIDIDNNIEPELFLSQCRDYNFEPNIIYSSFSDTPEFRKWRALWVLDEPITNYDRAEFLRKYLIKLFNSDESCKDASRMFYPGKEILFLNQEIMVSNYFESVIDSFVASKMRENRHFKHDFDMIKGRSAKNANPIYNTIGFAENADLRNIDWASVSEKIKILDIFFNSDFKLDYRQILGIASNLQYMEGGLKKMKERMLEVNKLGGGISMKVEDNGKRFKYNASHFGVLKIVKYGYLPMMLSNFSPFEEDWEYHNILSLRKIAWGDVEFIEKKIQIELKEAEDMMLKQFKRVIDEIRNPSDIFNLEPKLYIFKLSTGIGKTEMLTHLNDALICFPNHSLKNEVSTRMKVNHYVTPEYPVFSNEDLNNYIQSLYNCGLYNIVSDIISNISKGKYKDYTICEEDILIAKSHVSDNEICNRSRDTVLTTHTRAIFGNFSHDYIVYDEDPLKYMVEIGESILNFSDFDQTEFKNYIEPIENYYRNIIGDMYLTDNNKFNLKKNFQEYCAKIGRGDIIRLMNSNWIYKDPDNKGKINWCKLNKIKLDKPTIILSATAAEDIYKKMFPGRVEVIDISNIKNMGVVSQFTNKSYSSSSLSKMKKEDMNSLKKEMKSRVGKLPVITHLRHKDIFNKDNWSKYHFGNCSGGDSLNGEDIAVVGTPHKPMFVYMFYSKVCGVDIQPCDNIIVEKVIERNGMKFRAMTFDNKDLQDIQLSLIEEDLIQAAGRARVLRNICEVKIFSNIPLKISDKINNKPTNV